jgi:hypothetical protein
LVCSRGGSGDSHQDTASRAPMEARTRGLGLERCAQVFSLAVVDCQGALVNIFAAVFAAGCGRLGGVVGDIGGPCVEHGWARWWTARTRRDGARDRVGRSGDI